jgi:hypothetical protein
VQDNGPKTVLWVGNNHGAAIVKVENSGLTRLQSNEMGYGHRDATMILLAFRQGLRAAELPSGGFRRELPAGRAEVL